MFGASYNLHALYSGGRHVFLDKILHLPAEKMVIFFLCMAKKTFTASYLTAGLLDRKPKRSCG